jgi:hypothetical protein
MGVHANFFKMNKTIRNARTVQTINPKCGNKRSMVIIYLSDITVFTPQIMNVKILLHPPPCASDAVMSWCN